MARSTKGTEFGLRPCLPTIDALLTALRSVSDRNGLASLMSAITSEMGFRYYALIDHDDLRDNPANRVRLLDYPAAVEERIIAQATWRRDPVIRACIFSPRAFHWSELPDIIELNSRDLGCLEIGARSGLNEGITVPYQRLGDCTGSCTFAGTRSSGRGERYVGMAQMIGVFAFQAARRILTCTKPSPGPRPRLHPRPRDCVLLAGKGLSNKQIARQLGLAPRTVDGYLTEARQIFGVHNRAELVISALYAGEIAAHELAPRQPG